jgi:hypothetical protein
MTDDDIRRRLSKELFNYIPTTDLMRNSTHNSGSPSSHSLREIVDAASVREMGPIFYEFGLESFQ